MPDGSSGRVIESFLSQFSELRDASEQISDTYIPKALAIRNAKSKRIEVSF